MSNHTKKLASKVRTGFLSLVLVGMTMNGSFAGAEDITQEIKETELHEKCDLRADQFDDDSAQRDCAATCFTAMAVASTKAKAFHEKAMLADILGLLVALAVCAGGAVLLMRKSGHAGWAPTKRRVVLLVCFLVALGSGAGAAVGLHSLLAWPSAQGLYQDMLIMKRAGKTGESGAGGMSCTDTKLKGRLESDLKNAKDTTMTGALSAVANYNGVVTHFERVKDSRQLQNGELDNRWRDSSQALQSANSIDPALGVVNSVISSSPFYDVVSSSVPFPKTALLGGLVGAISGLLLALLIRRFAA